jgi:hypothetical protein
MLHVLTVGLALLAALAGAEPEPWADAAWTAEEAASGPAVGTTFVVGGGRITVSLPGAALPVSRSQVLEWIGSAATAVAAYYGRFPVAAVGIRIGLRDAGRIGSGVTHAGRTIRVALGPATTAADLRDDWIMTHEMIHLAFPDLDDRFEWMEEGLATYLEPVIRVRAGDLPASTMWGDLLAGLPKGQPTPGGGGLDQDHAWGRTYWGGAGFWLLADLGIRQQTAGRHSLDDALRAILDAGGDGTASWSLDQVLEASRKAVEVDVLGDLYRRMGPQPMTVDLDGWWQRLGIGRSAHGATFDDGAPLAGLRLAIAR